MFEFFFGSIASHGFFRNCLGVYIVHKKELYNANINLIIQVGATDWLFHLVFVCILRLEKDTDRNQIVCILRGWIICFSNALSFLSCSGQIKKKNIKNRA